MKQVKSKNKNSEWASELEEFRTFPRRGRVDRYKGVSDAASRKCVGSRDVAQSGRQGDRNEPWPAQSTVRSRQWQSDGAYAATRRGVVGRKVRREFGLRPQKPKVAASASFQSRAGSLVR